MPRRRAAPNFGCHLAHGPLLVSYGAAAEGSGFTDPNTAMVKCRQFGEGAGRAGVP
jgi:type I restriction enzyme R subunit